MLKFIIVLSLTSVAFGAPKTGYQRLDLADTCNEDACQLPDCRCASTSIPGGLSAEEVPQFVLFTFDDAVTAANFEYYRQAFFDKVNPDGCPVGSTYYVSHEYTDYTKVHELHARGQEIALHSISHQTLTTYWQTISLEELKDEFGGERELVAHFADIPIEDIGGMRLPFLQLSGNQSFEALKDIGLKYDCSWPTQNYIEPGLWPYTLDYKSVQDCSIGPCPDASIKGTWVMPMIDWLDTEGIICAMVDSCQNIPDTEDELLEFFITNFNYQYKGNKAPFGFYVHAAWFLLNDIYFNAYLRFIDYLQTLDDVYIVNTQKALEWIQNPVSIKNGPLTGTCQTTYEPTCTAKACQLYKGEEERWLTSCVTSCPKSYPWLGNPLGENDA